MLGNISVYNYGLSTATPSRLWALPNVFPSNDITFVYPATSDEALDSAYLLMYVTVYGVRSKSR